jgi:acetyl esterase/lipase
MKACRFLALPLLTFFLILSAGPPVPADAPKKAAAPKEYLLWPDGAPGATGKEAKDIPNITVYLPPADKATGAAVVVCPGGGYGGLAMSYEGHDVARWLNTRGVAGIVLKYRVALYRHPVPLHDAQRALRFTRAHAEKWGIDPKRVGILGFSAGGHLASTAATHFDDGNQGTADPIDREGSRPDFAVLVYPVITLQGPYAHVGSRNNLLGKNPDPKTVEGLCNDLQVTKQTPPTFLAHTSEDNGVPPENSILFYMALRKAGVPAELHVYEKGPHGLGMGRAGFAFSSWPERCVAWMQARKLLGGKGG